MKQFSQEALGTIYALLAYTFWGLVPIYFKLLEDVSPFEILAHRILWSVLFLFLLIILSNQYQYFLFILKDKKKLKILFISSLLISLNWLVFIWAITNNNITEASLGYFINPLVSIALGKLFFNEKISRLQALAIFIAFLAIVYQVYALGSLPIVSLILALCFALYGLARKKAHVAAATGLLIETILISPFALIYFIYLVYIGSNAFVFPPNGTSWILVLAGLITIVPLLWFNGAVTRISMAKLGFLQYIAPCIAFILAIFIYDEPFNTDKFVTFLLIWIALVIFSADSFRNRKQKNNRVLLAETILEV